jgi:hypothetical protein
MEGERRWRAARDDKNCMLRLRVLVTYTCVRQTGQSTHPQTQTPQRETKEKEAKKVVNFNKPLASIRA